MATKTFVGGSSNNTPGDPANWTPYGAPTPGDTLLMNTGTMNIGGGGLAGDTLILGQGQSSSSINLNLFDGAVLTATTAEFASVTATVNVDGRATATFREANPSTAKYMVNLDAGSTLLGNYSLNFDGIKVNAADGAVFENDGASASGGASTINADVIGSGSFRIAALQGTAGSLEFGRSVAATETVNLSGNPYRASGNVRLTIDQAQNFHALVNLSDGTIELKNLGADSYSYTNDTLTLFNAGAAVDTLRVHNTTTDGSSGASVTPLSVFQQGADIEIEAGAFFKPSGILLPQVQSPLHVAAVSIFDTTTGAAVPDTLSHPYTGPVAGITTEFVDLSPDSLNITATTPNMFLHTGSGNDAINVSGSGGTNVLDGSTGSNFLVGGTGRDTFFVDDRGAAADIWSTVSGFHAGDAATIFGVTPSGFAFDWEDNQGATGFTGLTLHATAVGKPTASLTLAGYSKADLGNGRLSIQFSDASASSPYLYVHAT